MEVTPLDLERRLRFAGLRVTRSRTTVLAAVQAHPHADTDMVVDAARRTLPDISRQAVHDSLRALVEVGLVRRFQLGPVVRFEASTRGDHHHAVCTSCGRIADVDCSGGGISCLSPADSRGFLVNAVEVVYRGLCPDCAGRSGTRPLDRHHHDRHPASHAADGTRAEPEPHVGQRPEPTSPLPAAVGAARPPTYPSGRRARLGRVASVPGHEPLTPATQPGPPDLWSQPDPVSPRTDDLPASGTRAKHQLARPEAHPWTSPEQVPDAAPDTRLSRSTTPPSWFPTEPLRARSRREADEHSAHAAPFEGHDKSADGSTPEAMADALPSRRRARHEASRTQPV